MPSSDSSAPPPAANPPDPKEDASAWFAREILPHEGELRGYLHARVNPTDVDDLVQESYLRLFRALARGEIRSPRGLLFTTAQNAVRDLFRRRSVARVVPIAESGATCVFDEAPGVRETVNGRQEVSLLAAAIDSLPPRCREILVLRKFENLSHREIAARLGVSVHTVEAQLTKAVHRCEEFFARYERDRR